ncbi:MAG: putative sensor domain DACNV-containing protein [Polyangiales bacterium]
MAAFVRERWQVLNTPEEPLCPLPRTPVLQGLLSTAYQATLLREEERPVVFRLIVSPPQAFPRDAGPPHGLHRLMLEAPRTFDEHELRRLAPAAKYHRALIAVGHEDDDFHIWGILQSGPRWLQNVLGGRAVPSASLPEGKLVVHASAPGRLVVASGSTILGELHGGKLTGPSFDVFESKWLPDRFSQIRGELIEQHAAEREDGWGTLDDDFVRVLSQHMIKRVIATMRASHHGGTLVFLPPDLAPPYLSVKYGFLDEEPRRRFHTIILGIMRALARSNPSAAVGWHRYLRDASPALAPLDDAIFELAHTIAALADVDGAVVLTKRFEVLGFGAEIVGELPPVLMVRRALDIEGTRHVTEPVEAYGTRHRAAYRLCAAIPGALAIVVSQEGNVRFVSWHDHSVTYWDHVGLVAPA